MNVRREPSACPFPNVCLVGRRCCHRVVFGRSRPNRRCRRSSGWHQGSRTPLGRPDQPGARYEEDHASWRAQDHDGVIDRYPVLDSGDGRGCVCQPHGDRCPEVGIPHHVPGGSAASRHLNDHLRQLPVVLEPCSGQDGNGRQGRHLQRFGWAGSRLVGFDRLHRQRRQHRMLGRPLPPRLPGCWTPPRETVSGKARFALAAESTFSSPAAAGSPREVFPGSGSSSPSPHRKSAGTSSPGPPEDRGRWRQPSTSPPVRRWRTRCSCRSVRTGRPVSPTSPTATSDSSVMLSATPEPARSPRRVV